MKVGLYFGSFNPVHIGHLIIASHIVEHSGLDQVWFVVSPQNPFKNKSALLNEQHRLSLIQLAIEGETKLKASNAEFKLPKPSYTINTLVYLSEKYPEHTFSIIMGSDSYQNIEKWKNYEQIINNYNVYVYTRPSFPVKLPVGENIIMVDAPLLEISASAIRKNIRQGHSIRYLVADEVKNEIEAKGYYSSSLENPPE